MKRLSFHVEIDQPEGTSVQEVKEYIECALESWCKSYRPPGSEDEYDEGDPLFDIGETVLVKRAKP